MQATAEKTFIPPLDKSYISMRRTKHVEELIEDDEQKPDFDDMMNEVQEEIEEHDAEDAVVSRAPELRQLSET